MRLSDDSSKSWSTEVTHSGRSFVIELIERSNSHTAALLPSAHHQ